MLKHEIIERLKELEKSELLEFEMNESKQRIRIHNKYLQNHENAEILESIEDNSKCFYCSVNAIYPVA